MFNTLALLSSLAMASSASGQDGRGGLFSFFGGRDIDYWAEGRLIHDALTQTPGALRRRSEPLASAPGGAFSGSTVVRAADAKPFTWSAYRDPRAVEFWDDGGDYIPPRPLREAAAAPTAKNVDEYLNWQARKAEVLGTFQAVLSQRGTAMLQSQSKSQSPAKAVAQAETVLPMDVAWRQLKVAYFYQTNCPHCRASKEPIEEARRLGAQVTFIQLDHRSAPPMHTPSIPYGDDWNELFHITSTPTWVLSLKGKTLRHTGAMSLADLRTLASTAIIQEESHEPSISH